MAEPTEPATSTLDGARGHARAQAAAAPLAKIVPSWTTGAGVIWDETIPFGNYASRRLPRGTTLEITDAGGDACVQLFVHNAALTSERLCVMDTVKVQWQAYLSKGALLLSDMGRVLMTITDDTSQRHDCLAGALGARDMLCLGAAKFGLNRSDVGPTINLFKGVRISDDGAMHFEGDPKPGATITLRAEIDVLVHLAVTPHPLAPNASGNPVRALARRGAITAGDDPFRTTSPERARAFENTDEFLLGYTQ